MTTTISTQTGLVGLRRKQLAEAQQDAARWLAHLVTAEDWPAVAALALRLAQLESELQGCLAAYEETQSR